MGWDDDPIRGLLAPVDAGILAALREEWGWILPPTATVLGVTRMGDWLFREGEAIRLLDVVEGTIRPVAADLRELHARIVSSAARDELFLEGLAVAIDLPRDHCVGFRVPPILGGETVVSNLEAVPVVPYQQWTARLHRALTGVPPGAAVIGVEVGDDGAVVVRWR